MRRVLVFDRFDSQVCELAENDVFELTRHEVVNGEHELSITTTQVLEKGWRVVMQDDRGYWHEWIVSGIDDTHANGSRPYGSYYCVWSVQPDLMGTRVSAMPGVQTPVSAAQALDAVLSGTSRWTRGTITNTNTGGASMYDTDGWSAMSTLVANWGGEVDTTISVSSSGVVSRQVDLYSQQGESTAKRRFDFGADLVSVRRTIADDPLYCRITPRGRGEETEGGGYGRKITIESVNGGKDYLVNDSMVDLAKLPDGNGGWEYPTLEVENPECETPSELLAWSQGVLEAYTTPKVTYEVDVVQAAMEGVDFHGVSLGDSVQIVDGKFNDLRLTGRVMEITTDELAHTATSLTIGHIGAGISERFSDLYDGIRTAELSVTQLSESLATSDYIDDLLTRINAEVNATGGYVYITQGQGFRTYDVAVSDPLVGTEASSVVEIKGGTIRIANSKDAQGQWEWKTVFQSGHVLAELVTAANLVTGYIGNPNGTYWDLDNNLLHLPATTIMDDTNLGAVLDKVDATITGVDVQYAQNQSSSTAPTSGWSTTAPAWREGYYIWQRTATTTPNGTTYSTPVMISGRDGEDGSSVTILGSYNTLAELQAAHPTGNAGDGYIVGNDLYVWNGTAWEDVGAIRGPQGPAGADGEDGSQIWTATSDPTTPNYTFPLSSLTGPNNVTPRIGDLIVRSYYRYTITSVGSTSVLAGVRTSIRGAAGANGTSVSIQSSTKVGDTTTVVLTDGTTTSTLSIVDGADGVNGTPGAGGYVHIAWATSEDGSEGFSTTDSEGKTYIGVYTDHTAADSTDYHDYSWSLIQGQGVSDIVEQYYLSTSDTTQSGGSWSTDQPIWESSKYIWTRSKITWTDGTVSYTEPVLAQAINGANEVANYTVGGTNLLSDTNAPSLTKVMADYNRYIESASAEGYTSTIAAISDPPCAGIAYGQHLVKTSGWAGHSVAFYSGSLVTEVKPGRTYTMSCYARNVTASSDKVFLFEYGYKETGTDTFRYVSERVNMASDTAWHRYSWTFTTPSTMQDVGIRAYPGGVTSETCDTWICGWKLETGEKPTDWSISMTDALYPNTMVRAYGAGVLVCKQGNTIGALVNSAGSFDVVAVTWSGNTPTAGTVYATYGATTTIGKSSAAHVTITDSAVTAQQLNATGTITSEEGGRRTEVRGGQITHYTKVNNAWKVAAVEQGWVSGSYAGWQVLVNNNAIMQLNDKVFTAGVNLTGTQANIGVDCSTSSSAIILDSSRILVSGTQAYTGSIYLTYGNGGKIYLTVKNGIICGWTV